MKTKKYRILKITAVICFIFAVLEIGLALLISFAPISKELFAETLKIEQQNREEVIMLIRIIVALAFWIEAIFYIIEGFLIYRAIKKGKTTLIIVLLLLGFITPLITLINAAINSSYDLNSATNLVSIVIKTVILKQVFEIRRLNED